MGALAGAANRGAQAADVRVLLVDLPATVPGFVLELADGCTVAVVAGWVPVGERAVWVARLVAGLGVVEVPVEVRAVAL